MNTLARSQNKAVTFDPSITSKTDLTECFRIFVDQSKESKYPATRCVTPGTNLRHQKIEVYMDGACINNGKQNAHCGSGIWFAQDDPRNRAIRIPGIKQSNQIGEIAAIIAAVQEIPPFCPLEIISDSKYAIDGLTTHLPEWEDRG